jgi:hypothetical protein
VAQATVVSREPQDCEQPFTPKEKIRRSACREITFTTVALKMSAAVVETITILILAVNKFIEKYSYLFFA